MGSLKFLHLSWAEVQRLSEILAERIRKSGFQPKMIVAVSRGGFTPARILCDELGVTDLASVQVEYYSAPGEPKGEPRIVHPLSADVPKQGVLISDDVADTGHSLVAVREHVIQKGASEPKITTLHYKPWSVIEPDFYVDRVEEWIVYPWERKETAKQVISKLRAEGKNEDEIRKRMLEFGFPARIFEEFLRKV